MKIPKRFALSTLLLLMLIVASVFGYAQWRKLKLQAEVADLNQHGGVTFPLPNQKGINLRTFNELRLSGEFWPSVEPTNVHISIHKTSDNKFHIRGKLSTPEEMEEYLERIHTRLYGIGVQSIEVTAIEPRERGHWPTRVKHLNSLLAPVP